MGGQEAPQFNSTIWFLTKMELGRIEYMPRTFQNNKKKLVMSEAFSEYDVISFLISEPNSAHSFH